MEALLELQFLFLQEEIMTYDSKSNKAEGFGQQLIVNILQLTY